MESKLGSKLKDKSLVEAIEDKYGSFEEELTIQIFVPKGAPGQKDTGEIIVPQELCLDGCGITYAGDKQKITDLCGKKVTLLHLSENALSDWAEVFQILEAVPLCEFLDLRKNPLSSTLNCELQSNTYPILSKLVLNDLALPWETVTRLLQLFPSLVELHLSLNNYESVDLDGQCYPKILSLHFIYNSLSHWTEVAKLGKAFPNLECLFLFDNPLCEFPEDSNLSDDFSKLKHLSISQTKIESWEQLETFRTFPRLTDLKAQGIDFLEQYEEDLRRQLLLAYLPNITRLNGGQVSEGEKEDAERACIRHYMDQSITLPQRYHELEAKHGKLDPLVEIDFNTPTSVTVTCYYKEKSFLKTVDLKWTLTDLKKELERDVGLSASNMILFHQFSQPYQWTDHMIYPQRTMLRYNLQDDHMIYVEENTPAAKISFMEQHCKPVLRALKQ